MTTITNTTGTKAVNIINNEAKSFICMYVQIYNGQEQVLESKTYSSINASKKWATNKLK